jgi:phosphoglycolate phosphatase
LQRSTLEIEAIAFDLDGTLVDSVPDLTLAVAAMMVDLDLRPPGETQVRAWVGNGAPRLVKRALTGRMDGEPDPALFELAMPIFNRHYANNICVDSRLFPGVRTGLQGLQALGYALACVTNKPTEFTRPLIDRLGIADFFTVVLGGDATERKKPAPDALLLAAERLGVTPQRMLLVGDSINDVGAARNAGCPVVCVPYGYNHGLDIRAAMPDRVIDSIAELPALLKRAAQ